MLMGVRQFCTKPGFAFVPSGEASDRLVAAAADAVARGCAGVMLNDSISARFAEGLTQLTAAPAIREVARGQVAPEDGRIGVARLLEVDLPHLSGRLLEECFGPVTIIVRYRDNDELVETLRRLPASLTSTIHTGGGEAIDPQLRQALEAIGGRVVYNGCPSAWPSRGRRTTGGGWPATNTQHTSVGITSIRRFLRPLTWQDTPESDVPAELRDEYGSLPRRVDGRIELPPSTT